MNNKFLELYKNNKALSNSDKIELVTLFGDDLVFDEVFAKPSVDPLDLASILENFGNFWVTIDSDPSNRRQPHAVVICDISRDSIDECLIKYYDVFNGNIEETKLIDFIKRIKDGSDDLKTAVIRRNRNKNEGKSYQKFALFLSSEYDAGSYKTKYEFDDHWKCLQSAGYKNIRVNNGQDIIATLQSLNKNSIKTLIILSHSFSSGIIAGHYEDGFYQKDYISNNKTIWEISFKSVKRVQKETEYAKDDQGFSSFDLYFDDYLASSNYSNDLDKYFISEKSIRKYIEMSDFKLVKEKFKSDALIILGGCNSAGYSDTDIPTSFCQELNVEMGIKVIGSVGAAAPVKNECKRNSSGNWYKITSLSSKKKLGKTIDFTKF